MGRNKQNKPSSPNASMQKLLPPINPNLSLCSCSSCVHLVQVSTNMALESTKVEDASELTRPKRRRNFLVRIMRRTISRIQHSKFFCLNGNRGRRNSRNKHLDRQTQTYVANSMKDFCSEYGSIPLTIPMGSFEEEIPGSSSTLELMEVQAEEETNLNLHHEPCCVPAALTTQTAEVENSCTSLGPSSLLELVKFQVQAEVHVQPTEELNTSPQAETDGDVDHSTSTSLTYYTAQSRLDELDGPTQPGTSKLVADAVGVGTKKGQNGEVFEDDESDIFMDTRNSSSAFSGILDLSDPDPEIGADEIPKSDTTSCSRETTEVFSEATLPNGYDTKNIAQDAFPSDSTQTSCVPFPRITSLTDIPPLSMEALVEDFQRKTQLLTSSSSCVDGGGDGDGIKGLACEFEKPLASSDLKLKPIENGSESHDDVSDAGTVTETDTTDSARVNVGIKDEDETNYVPAVTRGGSIMGFTCTTEF